MRLHCKYSPKTGLLAQTLFGTVTRCFVLIGASVEKSLFCLKAHSVGLDSGLGDPIQTGWLTEMPP